MTVLVTLPASHAYVDAVIPPGVEHLDTTGPAGSWAPDQLWDPRTWATVATDVDVVHVHFGFDHVTPDVLQEWVDVTRAYRVRLVVTVHDLRNPHQHDASVLERQLAVLVPAADVVLTLTDGAAAEIAARFGRDATVVAHPAVFDGPADVPVEPGLVGVHLKSFRSNLGDVAPGLRAIADGVAAGGGRLEVDVHTEVADDLRTAAVREVLADRENVALRIHDRFDDDSLQRYLTRLSVSVQLQRWGTHSGWVEACHDVGTTVVAPAVGYLAEQWPAVEQYPTDELAGPDAESLRKAVAYALTTPAAVPADRAWRQAQLDTNRTVHARAYGV